MTAESGGSREQLEARNAAMRVQLDAMLEDYRAKRSQLAELQAKMGQVGGAASSPDDSVTVTVDARGRVADVRFSGYALRQAAPEELAAKIVAAARAAAAQVDQRMEQLVSPLLPAGTTFEHLAGAAPDLTRLLPEDPTARLGGGSPVQHRRGTGGSPGG